MRNRKYYMAFHTWTRQNFPENLKLWLLLPVSQFGSHKAICLSLCFAVITVNDFIVHYRKVPSRHVFYIAFFGYSFLSHDVRIPMYCHLRLHEKCDYLNGLKIASEFLNLVVGFPYSQPTSIWSTVLDNLVFPFLGFCRFFIQFWKCTSAISHS